VCGDEGEIEREDERGKREIGEKKERKGEREREGERTMPTLLLVKPKLGMINDRREAERCFKQQTFPKERWRIQEKIYKKEGTLFLRIHPSTN